MTASRKDLTRLLSPRSIAFVGGSIAEMAIERCLEMGYDGEILPVNPNRATGRVGFNIGIHAAVQL